MTCRWLRTLLLAATAASAAPAAEPAGGAAVKLWRLDCGTIAHDAPKALPWRRPVMPSSCYLIRHGDRYMLWDAGLSARAIREPTPVLKLERTIVEQLADIGVRPDQIEMIGISHDHGDHTGQAKSFPTARLFMGAEDVAALRRTPPPVGSAPTHLTPWLQGKAPLVPLVEDHDVFGDGKVVILMTRGHTPGHTSLLVRLASRPILLSGDLWSSHDSVLTDEVPVFSASFAETAASRERFRRLARALDALAILQHELDDVGKLPPFPMAAE